MATPPPLGKPPAPVVPAGRPSMPPKPLTPAAPKTPTRAPRSFSVGEWSGKGEGEKVTVYGGSGMGKTTLASMAPRPVWIGLDDGGRKIRDPRDGSVLNAVHGIQDFQDVRDVLHTPSLFDGHKSIVIDTITKLEELSEPYLFENYKTQEGKTIRTIEGYGWGKGYRHSLEVMRLILQDCEALVRKGYNIILLAQEHSATMPNADGLDFLQAGPKLHHTKQASSRLEVQEWSDHVLRIDYLETSVAASGPATKGKITSRDTTRAIFTQAARHFFAKTRTLSAPVISFAEANDDSLWQMMFPEA